MTTVLSNSFTVDDLESMPDDGKRYELIGGAIVMTPAPEPVHQRVAGGLFLRIEDACPPGHAVSIAPIDFDLPGGQRVEPDIIGGIYEPYADSAGPVALDWPVQISFSVPDLARPRTR